eukprot:701679_1
MAENARKAGKLIRIRRAMPIRKRRRIGIEHSSSARSVRRAFFGHRCQRYVDCSKRSGICGDHGRCLPSGKCQCNTSFSGLRCRRVGNSTAATVARASFPPTKCAAEFSGDDCSTCIRSCKATEELDTDTCSCAPARERLLLRLVLNVTRDSLYLDGTVDELVNASLVEEMGLAFGASADRFTVKQIELANEHQTAMEIGVAEQRMSNGAIIGEIEPDSIQVIQKLAVSLNSGSLSKWALINTAVVAEGAKIVVEA